RLGRALNGGRLLPVTTPEESTEEAADPLELLLAGVDDRLLAVVVRVVVRVRVAGDLGLHVVEHDAPDLAADVLDVDLGALQDEAPHLARLVDEDHAVRLRSDD